MKKAQANGEFGRPLADDVPVDLLPERARELEHAREVGLLLGQREELRRHHVVERSTVIVLRGDLQLLGAREVLVADRPARRAEDQVDQRSLVVGLQQPSLGRPLGLHAGLDERLERALGVLLADEEVDVVLGRRAAASPAGEAAAEQVRDAGVAQRRGRDLHRVDQLVEAR